VKRERTGRLPFGFAIIEAGSVAKVNIHSLNPSTFLAIHFRLSLVVRSWPLRGLYVRRVNSATRFGCYCFRLAPIARSEEHLMSVVNPSRAKGLSHDSGSDDPDFHVDSCPSISTFCRSVCPPAKTCIRPWNWQARSRQLPRSRQPRNTGP
jgi:hypothetical protein